MRRISRGAVLAPSAFWAFPFRRRLSIAYILTFCCLGTYGAIEGTGVDPSGGMVAGATVEIQNPVSGYLRILAMDASGNFAFHNVPFNPYHLTVLQKGFQPAVQDVEVRSGAPVHLKIALQVQSMATNVTVTTQANDLLERTPAAHTEVDQNVLTNLPVQNPSIGLSQVITNAAPGVVADANGFFHPLSEHADTTLSVDGQPITDNTLKFSRTRFP